MKIKHENLSWKWGISSKPLFISVKDNKNYINCNKVNLNLLPPSILSYQASQCYVLQILAMNIPTDKPKLIISGETWIRNQRFNSEIHQFIKYWSVQMQNCLRNNYIVEIWSVVRAFSVPRFGADVLGSNFIGDGCFEAFI